MVCENCGATDMFPCKIINTETGREYKPDNVTWFMCPDCEIVIPITEEEDDAPS